jgi:thymidylate synthase ThyX
MLGSAPDIPDLSHALARQAGFSDEDARLLSRYFTNLDRPVFALRNLPDVVKGALFSRYSRTEKSLRRVLLEEFIQASETGFDALVGEATADDMVAVRRAEEFYERVLVGYGDDSVAELAGAHLAVEQVSILAAKALEDSRIGLSPLEKSTRYVRFDRRGPDGKHAYYRGPEMGHPVYERAMDALFNAYSELLEPLIAGVRDAYPPEEGEPERAWKAATRAKALDLLRGLLPAGALTNLGLYGNGRAFEYLITKLAAHELPECRMLARDVHAELSLVIPSFVKRAMDAKYGGPAAERLALTRHRLARLAPPPLGRNIPASVRLVEFEQDAERKVAAAALYPHSDRPWEASALGVDVERVLDAALGQRQNRRQRVLRALEHAHYTFEIVANFAAYRDLQRHRMLSQDRQLLGTALGFDVPDGLEPFGMSARVKEALERAEQAHALLTRAIGSELAQYAVPLAFRVRWYFRVSLREIYHLCELRTTPQGHPDYRWIAQEMFRRVQEVHPRLAAHASFVDLGPGDELERRKSERRLEEKLSRSEFRR